MENEEQCSDEDCNNSATISIQKHQKAKKSTPYKIPCSMSYVLRNYEIDDDTTTISLSDCISQKPSIRSKNEAECDMTFVPTCSSNLEHNVPLQMLEVDASAMEESGSFKLPIVNSYQVAKAQRMEMDDGSSELLEMSINHRNVDGRKNIELDAPGTSNSSDGSNSDAESQQATEQFGRSRRVIFRNL